MHFKALLLALFVFGGGGLGHATVTQAWKWKGFEVIGQHRISRAEIIAMIPIRLGSEFQVDSGDWKRWCEGIKLKFHFSSTNCSSIRTPDFGAFFVVDVVESGYEYRSVFRAPPSQNVPLATAEVMNLYEKFYQRMYSLFQQGLALEEKWDTGYLYYMDHDMHGMAVQLSRLVPTYRASLLDVLRNDKDQKKRREAANLLNWTVNDLEGTVIEANKLLDDPDAEVRNNISRFSFHFVDKLTHPVGRHQVIDNLVLQLDRPSLGDRNKALMNLIFLTKQFPEDRAYIRTKGLSIIRYIAETSVLSNVGGMASELLRSF